MTTDSDIMSFLEGPINGYIAKDLYSGPEDLPILGPYAHYSYDIRNKCWVTILDAYIDGQGNITWINNNTEQDKEG
jgi:hypothetical protein